jgi:hypothetical protein
MTHQHADATHHHSEDGQLGTSGPATVMADIGGHVGAAVIYTPEDLAGLEIEIRPVGSEWDGTHTAVRERQLSSSVVWAAFFAALHAGRYDMRLREDTSRSMSLDVVGGVVTEVAWENARA